MAVRVIKVSDTPWFKIIDGMGPSKKTAPVSSVSRALLEAERRNAARRLHTCTLLGTH